MIPRVTHTRLPEGRQDFKLRATGGVRLGESTNLTIACLLMLKGFNQPGVIRLQACQEFQSTRQRRVLRPQVVVRPGTSSSVKETPNT